MRSGFCKLKVVIGVNPAAEKLVPAVNPVTKLLGIPAVAIKGKEAAAAAAAAYIVSSLVS